MILRIEYWTAASILKQLEIEQKDRLVQKKRKILIWSYCTPGRGGKDNNAEISIVMNTKKNRGQVYDFKRLQITN